MKSMMRRWTDDDIYSLYLADEISREGFGSRYRPLEEQHQQTADQVTHLQGEMDFLKVQYLSRDEIVTEARDVYSRWFDLEPTEKRRLVEAVTEKIVIGQSDMAINLCYLAPSAKIMTKEQSKNAGSACRLHNDGDIHFHSVRFRATRRSLARGEAQFPRNVSWVVG